MVHEENLKPENITSKQTIVLRTKLLPQDVVGVLEKKKTSFFGSTLRRPKPDEVAVESPQLYFEQFIFVLGHYDIDFNRDTSYVIKVDPDVTEVTIGNEKFPISNKSGVWKKFGKKMKEGVGISKQDLEIKVSENVVKSMTDSIYLDNNGLETAFHYSISSDSVENYAQKVLDINKNHIRTNNLSDDDIFLKLAHKLKDSLKHDLNINHEKYFITEFREIFVPIYETKCYDNNNKVVVARVDAITGKLI